VVFWVFFAPISSNVIPIWPPWKIIYSDWLNNNTKQNRTQSLCGWSTTKLDWLACTLYGHLEILFEEKRYIWIRNPILSPLKAWV
jgi:hypothetical protein